MDAYHVFVDESGGFSFRRRKSFVGGFVCADSAVASVISALRICASRFNERLRRDFPGQARLEYPGHLHFMPLHVQARRSGADSSIRVDPKFVPLFVRDLLSETRPYVSLVFRSSGLPRLIANDHGCYLEVLRHTLLQLIDEPLLKSARQVKITIAYRRGLERYGIEGHYNIEEYESQLLSTLTAELQEAFIGNRPNIQIELGDGRKSKGLILADFYVGAMGWEREDYLETWDHVRCYPFSHGYRRIGQRLPQRLLDEYEHVDCVAASLRAVDALASNREDSELAKLVDKMTLGLDGSQRDAFCEDARSHLNDRLLAAPDRYDDLDVIDNTILILERLLPQDPLHMSPAERRLHAGLLLNRVRVEGHRGSTDAKPFHSCLEFLDSYGHLTFENQLELMQERVEAVLSGVQLSFFNSWKFESVEDSVASVAASYQSMFKDQLNRPGCLDANVARLEGTLGQMYAFLGDYQKDDFLLDYAEAHLVKDVNACLPGSPQWRQGMGYLTVLYWKRGDLDKAVDQFLAESEASDCNREDVQDLCQLDLFGSRIDLFLFLHRLNVCALAQLHGEKISGLTEAKAFALDRGGLWKYPRLQTAKWLAIMLASGGQVEEALPLMDEALKEDQQGSALEVLRLPIKVVRHICRRKLGRRSPFDVDVELAGMETRQPGVAKVLDDKKIRECCAVPELKHLYEIGTLLPYYYS